MRNAQRTFLFAYENRELRIVRVRVESDSQYFSVYYDLVVIEMCFTHRWKGILISQ